MRVAVNYPYFVPYTGYFRLFACTDVFVSFDCVPFPRRGFVHRNRLATYAGDPAWYTLAMQKAPRTTLLKDMRFVNHIVAHMQRQRRRFPVLQTERAQDHPLVSLCSSPDGEPVPFLHATLQVINELLGLPFAVVRSSELEFDRTRRGEARVLSILEALGATAYVNAPGGRHLYDARNFKARGITLSYLRPYQGPVCSILQRLLTEEPRQVAIEINRQSV